MSDAKSKSQLLEMDLYKLLDCEETCTQEQLKKAYRKRALELHPDKNPDKKEEAEKSFIQLGKAFEILADKSARAAYDAARKAKREKALRDSQMDAKRREMKAKLENREKEAKERAEQQAEKYYQSNNLKFFFFNSSNYVFVARNRQTKAEEAFFNEIERVRRENKQLLEEENNKIFEQLRLEKLKREQKSMNDKPVNNFSSSSSVRIKVTWPASESNRLDKQFLEDLFGKYGRVENFLVGAKASKPSALLEYKHKQDAVRCFDDEKHLYEEYSIQLKCLDNLDLSRGEVKSEKTTTTTTTNNQSSDATNGDSSAVSHHNEIKEEVAAVLGHHSESFEDLEARILKKMRSTKTS